MYTPLTKARIEILLLFALYLFILPRVYMSYDMSGFRDWALYIHQHGLQNAYNSTTNYPPVYIYVLYLFGLLQHTDANIINNIYTIKVLFVFFDFLPIFVLCCFRQKILSFNIPYLYLLLNIAYVFNSMVWGQVDSMYTNLVFLAIVIGISYPVACILLYLLALNTKLMAIEFLPVIAAVLLYSVRKFKTVFIAVILAGILQALILLPFMANGGVSKLMYISTHTMDYFHKLSISAFNFWYMVTNGNPYFINDRDTFFIFSYKTTGFILYGAALLLVLVPLLKRIWSLRKNNLLFDDNTYPVLFLSTGLMCLYFFYFNTQMHERYAHPVIIFFFFYGVVSNNYKLYILASIPYFLSLDKAFSFPDGYLPIVHYKVIFASKMIALWYTATVIYGSYLFYKLIQKPAMEVST